MSIIKIMGFDIGQHVGVSVMEIDVSPNKLEVISVGTIDINTSQLKSISSKNIVPDRLAFIRDEIKYLFEEHKPLAIAIESPFISRFSPTSIIPLAKIFGCIEEEAVKYDSRIHVSYFSPTQVKKAFGAKKMQDKDPMYEALVNSPYNNFVNIEEMSEHSIDSIGIAHALLLKIESHGILSQL